MREISIFVVLSLCVLLPSKIFSKEKDTPGLWPEDSGFTSITYSQLGVPDNDTIYYSPGHKLKLPLNILYYIGSADKFVYVLTNNQYILIQQPIYSKRKLANFPNDTIFTPEDSFIIQYLAKFDDAIGYHEFIDNALKDEIFGDDSSIINYPHFYYLYNYITMYYEKLPISLNQQRINKYICRNDFNILLFNFLPSEIDLAVEYALQIKQVKPDDNVKQWIKRHFCD